MSRCRTTADGALERWTLAFLLACFATLGFAADELDETLDADFLSYLGELEGEDDDWTIVEPPPAKQPEPASAAERSAQPAETAKHPPPAPPPKSDEQQDAP